MNLDWLPVLTLPTPVAIRALECLFALSAGIQTLEYLRMRPAMGQHGLWSWAIQRQDIPNAFAQKLFDALFAENIFNGLLWARLLALGSLVVQGANLANVTFLFVSNLAVLIRWRGAFNGGSDFMTLVAISGLLLAHTAGALTDMSLGWRAGFWYISLQTISSYFVSGWVKLLRPEWRSGRAMTLFLDTGIYGPLPSRSIFRHPMLARVCSWSFTVWEGCFPLALLDVRLAWLFCAVAALFHFLVFVFFGLNRFFWAWIATFPAVLYCAGATW